MPTLDPNYYLGYIPNFEFSSGHNTCHYSSGGKIVARYEAPAHKFLFPDSAHGSGELREVQLNKSRKYQVSRN